MQVNEKNKGLRKSIKELEDSEESLKATIKKMQEEEKKSKEVLLKRISELEGVILKSQLQKKEDDLAIAE